ncbi:DUF6802 family protein [Amycolatopsis granulosa]|uniref:DUF6802 family protein n=1 Tax=Amycolatopsis granulosa TaxID=185684 RepID=UPI001423BD86|nr:hypothetical protein [Amycolatopsis granulosa]
MWIDETGGVEPTEATTSGGDLEITVDGHTYTAEQNMDLDHDGVDDTVRLDNADGTITAYADTDGDGHADRYVHTDTAGNVVEMARYDESTGDWVADHGSAAGERGATETGRAGEIVADSSDGIVEVGPATVDSDNDGTADSAIVTDEAGNTRVFTDVDGDGRADVQTIITPDGETHTYQHTGPGEWTEAPSGFTAEVPPDSDRFWGGDGHQAVEGVARIDSGTGQWISQN